MRNRKFFLLYALVLALCVSCLSGCGSKAKADAEANTDIAKLYAEVDKPLPVLNRDYDAAQISRAVYSRDEHDELETEDAELIKALITGLREIKVTGEYKDDLYVTDSASSICFYTRDGESYAVHFDFGNLSVGQKLYTIDNDKQFNDAVDSLVLKYEDQ